MDSIIDVRGSTDNRFFKVQWASQENGEPWPKDDTTWEPARHLESCIEKVTEFWSTHPELDRQGVYEREGEHRCKVCGKLHDNAQELQRHNTKKGGCYQKVTPEGKNTKVTQATARMKKAEAQKKLDQVSVNEWKLENVYSFCYLGHHLQADGDAAYARWR